MRNFLIIFFIVLLFTGLQGISHPFYTEVYSNKNINSIHSNGSVLVDRCTINQDIIFNGSLEICNSSINQITLNGSLSVADSQINTAEVNGTISAKNSSFSELVSVASENTLFEDCKINDLLIRKTGSKQTVKLLGNTTISKNIRFEVPGGKVIASKTVQIRGKVINGNVVYN